LVAAAAIGAVITISGCNTSSLTKRELVVYFAQNATVAQQKAALAACSHVTTQATPEPFDPGSLPADSVGDVRYRIDHADDRSVALLENCLHHQPGVTGAQDSADSLE
jgi:hypothetical protein